MTGTIERRRIHRIHCGHCLRTHTAIAQVRECFEYERHADQEEHFCESPSCRVQAGCAAYRYDSRANGFWGTGEEERERYLWEIEDAMRAGELVPTMPPPPGPGSL